MRHKELWEMSNGDVIDVVVHDDGMVEVTHANHTQAFTTEEAALGALFFHQGIRLKYRVSE